MLGELGSGAGGTVYKALHAASLRLVIVVSAKTVAGRQDVTFVNHAPWTDLWQ